MTWIELAEDSLNASKLLLDGCYYRSSISRAYYAVYCAITMKLLTLKHVEFKHQGNNPGHDQVLELIPQLRKNQLGRIDKEELKTAISSLFHARVQADYVPVFSIQRTDALDAVKLASHVVRNLGGFS